MKTKILEVFKLNVLTCSNEVWIIGNQNKLNATLSKEFYCVEFLYKYGSFNDIVFISFSSIRELNTYRDNSESCKSDKWVVDQYYSDGIMKRFNIDL